MTILKRKVLRIKKRALGHSQEPKATGWVNLGGKMVWAYKAVKLPYSSSRRKTDETTEEVTCP